MTLTPKRHDLSPDEYLAQERKATEKSEYINGQAYMMAGQVVTTMSSKET